MKNSKKQNEFLEKVKVIINQYGESKAPREMCKLGLVLSHAQARRYISFIKKEN